MIEVVRERVPMCTRCACIRIDDVWLVPPPAAIAALEGTNTFVHSICEVCARALIDEEHRAQVAAARRSRLAIGEGS